MDTKDIEEMGWGESELGELFIAYVRRHRRSPSRRELERFRSEWFSPAVGWAAL